jgi:type I restriction enzyme S subunit
MFIGPFGSSLKNEVFVDEEDGFCMVYEQKHAIQKTMDVPTRYVPKSKYEELKRFTILGGDIIVSCRGTIGEIFVVPNDAPMGIMHPSIMKIRLNTEKYNQKFFAFALEQYMDEHSAEAKGSGVKMAVSATVLGQSDFVIPPIDVQDQFAAFVEQTDKSKFEIQQSLEKLETLKKALMQKYFG